MAEGREFEKKIRSLEQSIQTVKELVLNRIFFNLFLKVSHIHKLELELEQFKFKLQRNIGI